MPVDARAAEVRVGKMGKVGKGHERQPRLVVAGDQQQLARLFGPGMPGRLGHQPEAQARQVVDAGSMTGDGCFDRRLQAPVTDGDCRSRVAGSPLVERKLLGQRRDIVAWRARALQSGESGDNVEMHERLGTEVVSVG
jgi:hypothetical protein